MKDFRKAWRCKDIGGGGRPRERGWDGRIEKLTREQRRDKQKKKEMVHRKAAALFEEGPQGLASDRADAYWLVGCGGGGGIL